MYVTVGKKCLLSVQPNWDYLEVKML